MDGEMLLMTGARVAVTVSVAAAEVFPSGFTTVMFSVAGLAMSFVLICVLKCVLSPKTVVRWIPFTLIAEPLTKFIPTTLSVKAGPPASTLLGFSSVIVGGGVAAVTVSVAELETRLFGFRTVIANVAGNVTSAASSVIVRCELSTKFVTRFAFATRATAVLAKF